jgi:RNA polymerase sigma factor (sigma-70 family)
LESISDNAIMLKVKSGDFNKLGILFERYNRMLFGFFYRTTSNREVSEDLVQNLFIRIMKYRKQFRGDGKFSTWMYTIARNILADHFKQTRRKGFKIELTEAHENIDNNGLDVEFEEKRQILKKAMNCLEPDKLELLILSRYQGLKYREIAKIMKSSEGAIRIKIFRVLNDLKEHYLKLEKSEVL